MKWSKFVVLSAALSLLLICSVSCKTNEANGEEQKGKYVVLHLDPDTLEVIEASVKENGNVIQKEKPMKICKDNNEKDCCYKEETPKQCFDRLHPDMLPLGSELLTVVKFKGSCYYIAFDARGNKIFLPCNP